MRTIEHWIGGKATAGASTRTAPVFNPATGDSFSVNPLGQEIIRMVKSDLPEEAIVEQILEGYLVDRPSVEKDLYDFFNMLKNHKIAQ